MWKEVPIAMAHLCSFIVICSNHQPLTVTWNRHRCHSIWPPWGLFWRGTLEGQYARHGSTPLILASPSVRFKRHFLKGCMFEFFLLSHSDRPQKVVSGGSDGEPRLLC